MYQSQYVQPANVMQFEHAQPTYVIQSEVTDISERAQQLGNQRAYYKTDTDPENPCCGYAHNACFMFNYVVYGGEY